ncbi:GNAT family N-acetyltransferase [Sedimentibacter sp. MB31-C6]|uniref:GNAT family N-acetyltransferase n=1 Tax=Sedimentibacter sp. MB31-C6 TaxID=3109366 RepID=UPI002DDD644D|nr:GNAT family N-acetyltransferase [Sedimentibacter sp. MB36-C1]WSI03792.1 GNAT family N-acetyltransferase [Sedimentibacter sp. MB36-C1]
MKKIVETQRLIIREIIPKDIEYIYKIESNRDIIKYIPNSRLMTFNECKRQIKRNIKKYKTSKIGSWAVVLKSNNEVIGITQLTKSKIIKGIELGTKILPEYWGMGYATELSEAIIQYGLYQLNLKDIIAVTDDNNVGAKKSLENIGMRLIEKKYKNRTKLAYYCANKDYIDSIIFNQSEEIQEIARKCK